MSIPSPILSLTGSFTHIPYLMPQQNLVYHTLNECDFLSADRPGPHAPFFLHAETLGKPREDLPQFAPSSIWKKFALNSLAEYKKVSQAARGLTDRGQWVKDELARNALRAPPSKFEISFVRRSIFKAHAFCWLQQKCYPSPYHSRAKKSTALSL